jgi:hypothetical protein
LAALVMSLETVLPTTVWMMLTQGPLGGLQAVELPQ